MTTMKKRKAFCHESYNLYHIINYSRLNVCNECPGPNPSSYNGFFSIIAAATTYKSQELYAKDLNAENPEYEKCLCNSVRADFELSTAEGR